MSIYYDSKDPEFWAEVAVEKLKGENNKLKEQVKELEKAGFNIRSAGLYILQSMIEDGFKPVKMGDQPDWYMPQVASYIAYLRKDSEVLK